MQTIWFDALTPKHLRIAKYVKEIAERKGYYFLLTSRQYDELSDMTKILGLNPLFIGKHGKTLQEKMIYSAERLCKLLEIVENYDIKYIICHASPEATRIGFGFGIETININDSPHAEAVARLTIPLTSRLLSSAFIPEKEWLKYGLKKSALIKYKGLEVVSWLKREKPISVELNIQRPVVLFRPEEVKASYLNSKFESSYLTPLIRKAMQQLKFSLVVLPRYDSQRIAFKEEIPDALILEKGIDGLSIIEACDIFIGGGGTMTWEAALLGKPTLFAFPNEIYISKALRRMGLLKRVESSNFISVLKKILSRLGFYKKQSKLKAEHVLTLMEDPLDIIENLIR
ncbi:hypothetical protein B9Q11_00425 [Candidatus Marsarchaeota G2 archaeon ECH_B_SAG-F08]|uniref:Lipid-A-disaccharide synthase n=1 Tax=Candidatus Marsarchaeota G2 archaeon ECH_B_SAG-F08 TaxID=1978165 RepID=A0A2R6BMZ7_9ARCH|nr:MAG: hypothetical protein B9Q11_00425 [Candidatus Marsarchaeota G2 archaeon ECH_B_SAG-F08]